MNSLNLETLEQKHSEWFYNSISNDLSIRKSITNLPEKITLQDCQKQISLMRDSYVIKKGDRFIGYIGFQDNEVSYFILKSFRGKGYCQAALKEILSIYPYRIFYANPINETSRHILQKFGIRSRQ